MTTRQQRKRLLLILRICEAWLVLMVYAECGITLAVALVFLMFKHHCNEMFWSNQMEVNIRTVDTLRSIVNPRASDGENTHDNDTN